MKNSIITIIAELREKESQLRAQVELTQKTIFAIQDMCKHEMTEVATSHTSVLKECIICGKNEIV